MKKMMNTSSVRFNILMSSARVLLAAAALVAVYALSCAAAGEYAAPTAHYASTVSNRVQSLTLSVSDESSSEEMWVQNNGESGIFYTTDGSTPVPGSDGTLPYTGEILIDRSMTVKYCSCVDGVRSDVEAIRFVYLAPVSLRELSCKGNKPCRIALRWKSNRDADGYRVYRRKQSGSKWEKVAQLKGAGDTRYIDTKVDANATYSYYVASYKGKVESLKAKCAQSVKAKHAHHYRTQSVNCSAGKCTLKCQDCGETKKQSLAHRGHVFEKVKDGYYTVEKCKNCGKVSKKYLSKSIPEYWNDNIVAALKQADNRSELPGYVFITDPHWEKNAQNSPAIVNYVTREMGYSFAVCGGDVVATRHNTRKAAVKEINSFYDKFTVPVLSVEGNHDNNSNSDNDSSAWLSRNDISRLIYGHNPSNTHMFLGGDFAYCDDTKNKVRYITFYFDETATVTEEMIENIDARVSELSEDWSVVLFSHAFWHYAHPDSEPEPKGEAKKLGKALLKIQKNSSATIALWHVGHIHRDRQATLSDNSGTQLLVVASNCDTCEKSAIWGGLTMKAGTDTEQAMDIVQLDKTNGRIYMTRIGAGRSRSFRYQLK